MTGGRFPACSKGERARAEEGESLCSEPFRLFFPTGLVASVLGVSLWLLFYAGWLPSAPHVAHARVMIEGFFGAFVVGFAGTALPRMMSAPRLTRAEFWTLYGLLVLAAALHLGGQTGYGDGSFLAMLVVFLSGMGARFFFLREDSPPAGFVLVAMGFFGAIAAIVLLLAGRVVPLSLFVERLASLLLNEGFVLFPILGVSGILFPRILGVRVAADPSTWPRTLEARAVMAGACGLALWGSFALEAGGAVGCGRVLRAIVAAAYLLKTVPLFQRTVAKGTLGFSLRTATAMMFAGLLAAALYPQFQKGFDHLLFVSGFGLVALTVAARVVLGHAERHDLAEGRSRPMRWIVWIVLVAAATRASADPLPQIAVSHHVYAAILWAAAAGVWAGWLFPRLRERG